MPFGISILAKAALAWLCIGIFPAGAQEDGTMFSELNTEAPRMRTGAGLLTGDCEVLHRWLD
jgi:hypothetical protein